jgi:centractin
MNHGIINHWGDMELIWKYIYQELKANPKEFAVLLTEPPLSPLSQKFQLAQIFFESFSVPAFFLAVQGVLSL